MNSQYTSEKVFLYVSHFQALKNLGLYMIIMVTAQATHPNLTPVYVGCFI